MIIKCPECDSSFIVPAESLAPKGRKVRCSNCHTEWFQKYNDDEEESAALSEPDVASMDSQKDDNDASETADKSEDDDISLDDINPDGDDFKPKGDSAIPEGVKPDKEIDEELDIPEEGVLGKHTRRIINYGYASSIMIVVLLIFSLSGNFIVPKWPASMAFYRSIGFEHPLPGEDLIFDRVKATVTKGSNGAFNLDVSGKIFNPVANKRYVPSINYSVLKQDQATTLVQWTSAAPQNMIQGEKVIDFTSQYKDAISPEAKFLKIDFQTTSP